jgi:acetyl esterase/lipase
MHLTLGRHDAVGRLLRRTRRDRPVHFQAGAGSERGAYLQGQDPKTPSASPLFADLGGLPPTLVLVGTNHALLDDSTRLADRARHAGVDVTLNVVDEMYHFWPFMHSFLPEAREAVAEIGRFVQARTADPVAAGK